MNRRNFLKRLGIGLAVAGGVAAGGVAALPEILNPSVPPTTYSTYAVDDIIADYTNFSEFACTQHIDEVVAKAAEELGRTHGERIANLYAAAC